MDREHLTSLLHEGGFDALGHDSTDAVYAYDLDRRFIDANGELLARLGYSRADMEDRPFGSSVPPEDLDTALSSFAAAASGRIASWSTVIRSSAGVRIPVTVVNMPFFANGEVVAVLGIARDLEQLQSSRRRADDLEHQLETMLDSMPDSVMLVDREWTITFANATGRATAQALGRRVDEVSLWEVFPELRDGEFGEGCRAVMSEGVTRHRRALSPVLNRWVESTVFPIAAGIAIFYRDVDAQHRARLEREAVERRAMTQAALLDAASDAMIVRRLDGTISYWNRAAAELYGYTEEEAVDASARELLFDDVSEFDAAFAATVARGSWVGTVHQHSNTGRRLIVDTRWTLIRDSDGKPESVFSISSDVTDKRREESVRLRTQRLESLGTLAGGIAHDLNNVLTPILMTTQLLAEVLPDEQSRTLMESVERSARRGADLIRQVLTFASGDGGTRVAVDVCSLLCDLERFCRETLPRSIEIHFDEPGSPMTVLGDATQLTQVLINIVVNARDAMPDGGALRVTVAERRKEDDGSSWVSIAISDSGSGMDQTTLESIFEPFFTTKPRGSGTGLGLATSLSIVRQHGGALTVSSDVDRGTVFTVELPIAADDHDDSRTDSPPPAETSSPLQGQGRIVLVVEDEREIRDVTCRALEGAGFSTVAAENGALGLAAFSDLGQELALVLTDLNMPVMSGADMGVHLRALGYHGPILATSGGARPSAEVLETFATRFLAKPYSAHELVAAVGELVPA